MKISVFSAYILNFHLAGKNALVILKVAAQKLGRVEPVRAF
jgi:hypothetical protein